jgi:hypothetical protein
MGFMDKAKKMAEQAQSKIDEVQKDFNAKQGSGGSGGGPAPVEYDQHGRKITPASDRLVPEPGDSHTQGDPADDFPSAPPAPAAPAPAAGGAGDPLSGGPTADSDVPPAPADKSPQFPPPTQDPGAPKPGLQSGDPLAG